jgi:hypothetical protein
MTPMNPPEPESPERTSVPGAAPAGIGTMRFDRSRLSRNDQIVGIASAILLVSVFLPWFTVSVVMDGMGLSGSVSGSGTAAHGYLWLVFVLSLAIVGYLVYRALVDRLAFRLPIAHETTLMIATGVNFVLILLAFVTKPGGGYGLVHVGWAWGAFVGLIAATVAVVPPEVTALRTRRSAHASPDTRTSGSAGTYPT